jgi:hypothetical protein
VGLIQDSDSEDGEYEIDFFTVVLIELRDMCLLGKHSTAKLQFQCLKWILGIKDLKLEEREKQKVSE